MYQTEIKQKLKQLARRVNYKVDPFSDIDQKVITVFVYGLPNKSEIEQNIRNRFSEYFVYFDHINMSISVFKEKQD
jgi:uncharacterized alkaline shock family protein YloU